MKYSIIIPTYNHCTDLLKPCVDSILRNTDMNNVELVISANGCVDTTKIYVDSLDYQFTALGFKNNFKCVWHDMPLGFAKAVNEGIKNCSGEKIILLNNDTVLLDQPKNRWLQMLEEPFTDPLCGITGPVRQQCRFTLHTFNTFFCVMIDRKVFDRIGLLNEEYEVGLGEDVEFCIEAERAGFKVEQCGTKVLVNPIEYSGNFPIWHAGHKTLNDVSLVDDIESRFYKHGRMLCRKYNLNYYKYQFTNNFERYIAVKGEYVMPKEMVRYLWASRNIEGNKVLELGCSNGYGTQFLPDHIQYTGIDYDQNVVMIAKEEGWGDNKTFVHADINTYDIGYYDTIIAMEVIEHLNNGIEIFNLLRKHCRCLLVTVPYKEPPGQLGIHHKLHQLSEKDFPGALYYKFITGHSIEDDFLLDAPDPQSDFNLMVMKFLQG